MPSCHPFQLLGLLLLLTKMNDIHSGGHDRTEHLSWTPSSLPNSVVLISGLFSSQKETASIIPGVAKNISFKKN